MGECRNCGSEAVIDLGFIGEVAPFFLKRVLNLKYGLAPSGHAVKRFLRRFSSFSKAFQKIWGKSVLIEIQLCTSCWFIQPKLPFAEVALGRIYADYRSDSYNRERIEYEPEYASIAGAVGICTHELQTRTVGLTRWLNGKVDAGSNFEMLDYGGADGKFLPDLPGKKYVYDISDIAPVAGVERIKDESGLGLYSYVQLAHVLEHVSYPLALTRKAASCLGDLGYLYIEVPQELSDGATSRLANGDTTLRVEIHEHINRYCLKSVTELLRAAGLSLVAIQSEVVDFGWNKATIVRALGRKM